MKDDWNSLDELAKMVRQRGIGQIQERALKEILRRFDNQVSSLRSYQDEIKRLENLVDQNRVDIIFGKNRAEVVEQIKQLIESEEE